MKRSVGLHVSVALARLEQRLGWPGLAGLALLGASAVWFADVRQARAAPEAVNVAPPSALAVAAPTTQPLALPPLADVPMLLTRVQRTAVEQGLGWPKADYRVTAATDESPASVEIRCVLQGPYPAIRRFVTTLLQDMPTSTLREFSLSRPQSDLADVEARLTWVVYLQGTAP
jgi:hypothetical protein